MLKAFKYRIYPNKEQTLMINKTIGVCRFIYNLALETKKRAWESQINLSAYDLQKQCTDLKKDYDWMCEVDRQAIDEAIINVGSAYKNFYNGSGYPKFRAKRNGGSFTSKNGRSGVDWNLSTVSVPKIKNIPATFSKRFVGEIRRVIISKTPTNRYFASVLVNTEEARPAPKPIIPETTIGIDVGIKSIVVTSDGRFFEPNRKYKKNLKRLQCLQRRSARKKKGSNNHKKSKLCVAILHEKITNQRTDYIHKITTGLIRDNQAGTFVIEDLNVAGMLKNRKLSQAIQDVSFGELFRQLKYKCEWYGKNLIVINRFEPTSKTCSECGSINETLTLKDREWVCANCNAVHDRDFNAAKNIRKAGFKKISPEGIRVEPVESPPVGGAMKQESLIGSAKKCCAGLSHPSPPSAVQPEAVLYILPDGGLCSEEYYSFLTDEQKAQCKIYNGAVQDGKEDEGK